MTTATKQPVSDRQIEELISFINLSKHIPQIVREIVTELINVSSNLTTERAFVLRSTSDYQGREFILTAFKGLSQLAYHCHPEKNVRLNHILTILGSNLFLHIELGEFQECTNPEGVRHDSKVWFNVNAPGCTIFLNKDVESRTFDGELLQGFEFPPLT